MQDGLLRAGLRAARRIGSSHYENFTLAAGFLPKDLKQDLHNIYAFCRLADDFADESADAFLARKHLNDYSAKLAVCTKENVDDPIFSSLGNTINKHDLPLEYFALLLDAFRLDLSKIRYNTFEELRDYTRLSADPVGRIVLRLFGMNDEELNILSDHICTALQLANHWQDVYSDYQRGRIYLPQEDLLRFNIKEEIIPAKNAASEFRKMMMFQTKRTREILKQGKPLIKKVPYRFSWQLALYYQGCEYALRAIEWVGGDVLNNSAKLTKWNKFQAACGTIKLIYG